jgi:hypothetical protein
MTVYNENEVFVKFLLIAFVALMATVAVGLVSRDYFIGYGSFNTNITESDLYITQPISTEKAEEIYESLKIDEDVGTLTRVKETALAILTSFKEVPTILTNAFNSLNQDSDSFVDQRLLTYAGWALGIMFFAAVIFIIIKIFT